jgi:hypothetical protein
MQTTQPATRIAIGTTSSPSARATMPIAPQTAKIGSFKRWWGSGSMVRFYAWERPIATWGPSRSPDPV